jgi:Flp pilus assembly pilin Flp
MEPSFLQSLKSFAQDERGAVAIEYVFIAGAMFLAIIASFPLIANAVKTKLMSVGGYFATIS